MRLSQTESVTVAGLLLAAGSGSRFGGPKALFEWEGRSLLERGVDLLRQGGCDPVVVVLGASAELARPLAGDSLVVVAQDWADGMGASLRAGLAALEPSDAQACVVALVDQPLVGVAAVRRLVAVAGATAAVATYGGKPLNPVLLARPTWRAVGALAVGDVGARPWLRAHAPEVLLVACDDTGSADDLDTPEDLDRLRS